MDDKQVGNTASTAKTSSTKRARQTESEDGVADETEASGSAVSSAVGTTFPGVRSHVRHYFRPRSPMVDMLSNGLRAAVATAIGLAIVFGFPDLEPAAASSDSTDNANTSRVSLSLSTINLARPILSDATISYGPEIQVHGEMNVGDPFGVAGIVTWGHANAYIDSLIYAINVFRLGAQGLWYPFGTFDHGLQLGAQPMYTFSQGQGDVPDEQVRAATTGFSIAGLVGYKLVTKPGFTLITQLGGGPRFLTGSGGAESQGGQTTNQQMSIGSKFIFNINLGWSF